MNVPLTWLSDYVKLPTSEKVLTDKLTMVGHMLDKRKEVGAGVVIDLELRGNRADMFGLIGVARDISAIFHTPLRSPNIAPLPKTDPKMPLLKADTSIEGLVKRYIAVKLDVVVGPSPAWLADRLKAYGIDPVNNVVDVTNYVMVETSHPMHAFDADALSGESLLLRRAKSGEKFETIQQGTTIKLTAEDIAVCDKDGVACLTCIGGRKTKVTDTTKTIILETAVYDAANCRRTARRHKIATEGGGRHEKHQDPEELPFALARAVQILHDIAKGRVVGGISDYYPYPVKPLVLTFNPTSVKRLVGITLTTREITSILEDLDFVIGAKKSELSITVPTFRTDIKQEADIVEEIIRIYGYEKIPTETLSGELPKVGTPPSVLYIEKLRSTLKDLQMNEVITSTLIANASVPTFEQNGTFPKSIKLVNAPDPDIATLRPSLLPNLVSYAKRSLGFRQKRVAFFELGNIYDQPKGKKYEEHMTLGLIIGGETPSSWNKPSQKISFFDLKGVIEGFAEILGSEIRIESHGTHPSLNEPQITVFSGTEIVGHAGLLDRAIARTISVDEPLYCAELTITNLMQAKTTSTQPYVIAPLYPPIVEDMSFTTPEGFQIGPFIEALRDAHALIQSVVLLDIYENKRMLRITYADSARTLTNSDIAPIREKLIDLARDEFGLTQKPA